VVGFPATIADSSGLYKDPTNSRDAHRRQPARALRADGVELREIDLQYPLIKEKERGQCLVLGAGRDPSLDGQVSQERLDFLGAHVPRVTFPVEEDEASNPVDIGFLGPNRVVQQAKFVPDLIQQPRRGRVPAPEESGICTIASPLRNFIDGA
jgi:hypothetical protein